MVFRAMWSSWVLSILAAGALGGEYHVSLNGDDGQPGTKARPWKTFRHAVKQLKPGDTLLIHAGRYAEPIQLNRIRGTAARPIHIQAMAGQKVILDGSDMLNPIWSRWKGNIYRAKLKKDIWQLFYDNKMMTAARWPNAHMTDANFFYNEETMRILKSGKSPFGMVTDEDPIHARRRRGRPVPILRASRTSRQSLADAGFDATGCVAIMNIGSWMNFASRVMKHKKGSETFEYDKDFSESGRLSRLAKELAPGGRFGHMLKKYWHDHYYFLEGLPCLDVPGEYWYDKKSGYLHFYSPDGKSPVGHVLRGKRRTHMLKLSRCAHLQVRGIDFFAGAFSLENCENTLLESAVLKYPSYNEFQRCYLGEFPVSQVVNSRRGGYKTLTGNVIRNCRFSHLDGRALTVQGWNTVIENCLFHDVQYSCLGFAYGVYCGKAIIRHCTLYRSGAAEGFRSGRVLEFNHVWNIGGLQHDGSCFQAGGRDQVIFRYNWAHDTTKLGYRFDSGKNPKFANGFGQVYGNVAWNSGEYQIKGDDHLVCNNLALSPSLINLDTREVYRSTNKRTLSFNNMATEIRGGPRTPSPAIMKTNVFLTRKETPAASVKGRRKPRPKLVSIDPATYLRDPANWDFRPRKFLAGTQVTAKLLPKGFPAEWVDWTKFPVKAEIGPYRFFAKEYRIPGFQYSQASTPIPCNGGKNVPANADLMWLRGYRSVASDVYVGTSLAAVQKATPTSPEYQGRQKGNIFTPKSLNSKKEYYGRIDAIQKTGKIISGPVWRFTVR